MFDHVPGMRAVYNKFALDTNSSVCFGNRTSGSSSTNTKAPIATALPGREMMRQLPCVGIRTARHLHRQLPPQKSKPNQTPNPS